MNIPPIFRRRLPAPGLARALALACALAAPALAQTSSPGGSMVPSGSMGPAPGTVMMVHPAGGKLPMSDRFKTVADASAHCPNNVVVWSTLARAKVFHLSGSRWYGRTKHGAYICRSDALAYGFRPAKN